MNYSITYIPDDNFFILKATGSLDNNTFPVILEELFTHENWRPGMKLLSDYTKIQADHKDFIEQNKIAGYNSLYKDQFGHSKVAIVVNDDSSYFYSQRMKILVSDKMDVIIGIFRTMDNAKTWLLSESDSLYD